ncbi:MAG: 50S ribosomal protein L4 [Deltaproteobacteria bacterium]|nr:50S ribosomal protein L4 [Deltaproteobacteria bacterium]
MAVIDVLNQKGEKVSQLDLSDQIFDIPVKSSVLHEVVRMQMAKRRRGTAAVKHRSDIRGSGRKLFRQKGTGRARRGDIKSPLLRGGGSVFGPDPRSYAYKVPKKVRRLALKMALSSKLKDNKLMIVDQIDLPEVKTRQVVSVLKALNVTNALIVTDREDKSLERSSRNIPDVKVLRCEGVNVYDLLAYENLILLAPSITGIEGRLA